MKVKILKFIPHGEHNVNIDAEFYKNDGTLLFSIENRGVTSTGDTKQKAKEDFKQSLRNMRDTFLNEKNSKLKAVIEEIAETELDFEE